MAGSFNSARRGQTRSQAVGGPLANNPARQDGLRQHLQGVESQRNRCQPQPIRSAIVIPHNTAKP
jgi:hypothetical protein